VKGSASSRSRRFFALHVVLLPPLTLILIGVHVFLVRKHGVAPAVGDTAPPRKFYPEQVFKDTVGFAIAFLILFLMAVFVELPLEKLADPRIPVIFRVRNGIFYFSSRR